MYFLILDGDADRVGVGDENGKFIDQLRVFGMLAYYMLELRANAARLSKPYPPRICWINWVSSTMFRSTTPALDLSTWRPRCWRLHALIGGEESGGYAFHGHVPERDGILAGLYILDMMVRTGKKPSELLVLLFDKVGAHYYDRIDTRFEGSREQRKQRILEANPETIGGLKVLSLDTRDGFKFNLEDGGWLLIRFSGTEPIIRVYTETTQKDRVQSILEDGLRVAGMKLIAC